MQNKRRFAAARRFAKSPVFSCLPFSKVLAILLVLSVLALSACAAKQANSDTQKDSDTAETEQEPDSAQTAETQQPAQEAKRIEPLAESLDLNALTDATIAASFGAEDISEKDGKMELTLTVYDYDVYDMVDIAQLAVGDTIVVDGADMVVTSREENNGFVTINGGNGFQYISRAYYNVTRANGIKPSMSAVGCPYDNACAENFFSLLKTECIYRAQPQTFEETEALIDEYIYFYVLIGFTQLNEK